MVQEAERMKEADQLKKEGVTAKNEAETLCFTVEKQMGDLKDKISTADAEDLKKKIEAVRQATTGDDIKEIQNLTKELQEASWKVTQQAYQQSGTEGAGQEAKSSEGAEEKG